MEGILYIKNGKMEYRKESIGKNKKQKDEKQEIKR